MRHACVAWAALAATTLASLLAACSSGTAPGSTTPLPSSSSGASSTSSGGSSSGSTVVSSSYAKTCSITADCVLVSPRFNPCECSNPCVADSIAKSEKTRYDADVMAARASAECSGPLNCPQVDCAAPSPAVCFNGSCSTCAQHPSACQKDLYTRLGGDTGVDALMTQVITNELTDPTVASYFFAQTATTTPAGSPTVTQLRLCFRNLIKRDTTDPKIDDYAISSRNGGFACRDMTTAHAQLHVSTTDFDKFIAVFGTTLTQFVQTNRYDVSSAEIASLGTLLSGSKNQIVDTTRGSTATGYPGADAH